MTNNPSAIEKTTLHEMHAGQLGDFFALLCERERKSTRDGKPFYALRFRDEKRTVGSVPIWHNSPLFSPCESDWETGQTFKLRAVYLEHETYGPQIDIQNIRPAIEGDREDGFDPDAYFPRTRFDVDELLNELTTAARTIADRPLQQLVLRLLADHEQAIRTFPAASRNHHAYRGGFLEHTVSVLRTGLYLAEKYRDYYPELSPPINKDLIIAGCILHDIGKVRELDGRPAGSAYTVAGHLIGHILIGRDMVRDAARHVDGLNPELLLYLDHIITSHQGIAEWGSPKEPMLPEALLVHHADDIDAKMNIFVGILDSNEAGDQAFTTPGNILRRRLLKNRNV